MANKPELIYTTLAYYYKGIVGGAPTTVQLYGGDVMRMGKVYE